jgi:hypothetical protein
MKTLNFVMYIFYRYYSKGGTRRIPYFSALCATVFIIYLHIFQLLVIFDSVDLLPMNKQNNRMENYGKLALFLLPIFLILGYLVKEKDLQVAKYDDTKVKRGGIYLIIYSITSFILLFVLMFAFTKK